MPDLNSPHLTLCIIALILISNNELQFYTMAQPLITMAGEAGSTTINQEMISHSHRHD